MSWLLKNNRALFKLLFVLVILDRINTYFRFSIVFADSDQTLLWQVAKDMMSGTFHGPCFYGQSYNPVIEPLLAIPFLFSGLGFPAALPLATIILGLSPFLMLSFYFYKRFGPLTGILPLIISLLLPPEYSMLTSISRGFVTGIFFAVTGFVLFAFHKSFYSKFIGGISFGIGIYANPNCVLLFPLILPFLPRNRKELFRILMPLILGFSLGLTSFLFNAAYYNAHPDMVIHGAPGMDISLAAFLNVTGRLDSYFNFVTPLLWRAGWISLSLFVIIGIRLWQHSRKIEFLTLLLLFGFILFSFFVSKVSDGTNSVFFSGSRMFLAYPFILMFVFIFGSQTLVSQRKASLFFLLIALAILSFTVKILAFDFFLKDTMKGSKNSIVKVFTVNELRETCKDLLSFADGKVDLIIANSKDTPDQPVSYGCPCLDRKFPVTLQPLYERRSWLLPVVMDQVHKRVLIHGRDTAIWKRMHLEGLEIIRVDKQKGWLLIENHLTTGDLLDKIGLVPDYRKEQAEKSGFPEL